MSSHKSKNQHYPRTEVDAKIPSMSTLHLTPNIAFQQAIKHDVKASVLAAMQREACHLTDYQNSLI